MDSSVPVLAQFDAPQQLQATSKGLYVANEGTLPTLGTPLSSNFGSILGGQVEMSNVDLSQQFTDLIVIERGYQASSEINSAANTMLQQLLTMDSGR